MKFARYITVMLCALIGALTLYAESYDLPKHKIGNQYFYIYEVQKKENIYSVCKKLGISKEDLVKHNPRALEGIKAGDKIFIPADNDIVENTTEPGTVHQVQKNETLYAISKKYDTTPEEIIKANPDAADGVKNGDNIIIPAKEEVVAVEPIEVESDSIIIYTIKQGETIADIIVNFNTSLESIFFLNPKMAPYEYVAGAKIKIKKDDKEDEISQDSQFISYIAKKGDTFASIAAQFNTTIQALHQANPDIKAVKNKMKIYVPLIESEQIVIADNGLPEGAYELYDSIQDVIKSQQIEVALILPFMLNSETATKQSQLYTEFYRGFLMAVDSKIDLFTTPLNIKVFDSYDSNDTVKSLINSERIANAQYIIAPDNAKQLEMLVNYGNNTGAKVYNPFIVKNNLYASNQSAYQLNIPVEVMLDKVMEYMQHQFEDEEVIFLSIDNLTEKDVIPLLRKSMINKKGKDKVHEVSMETLSTETLGNMMESGKSYLIIPTNSSKSMVARINFGLKELKNSREDVKISLFGYPEWITYQNDYKDFFKALNTTIYSRFYANEESLEYRDFENQYNDNFNCNLMNAVPVFGALGYDLGNAVINEIMDIDSSIFEGVQNVINFTDKNNAVKGKVNDAIFMINFTEDGINRIIR